MDKIQKILNTSLESGTIGRKEHDSILKSIHADGQIDEKEKKILSQLFNAIQSGEITLVDEDTLHIPRNREQMLSLQAQKADAISRDSEVKEPTPATTLPVHTKSERTEVDFDKEPSNMPIETTEETETFSEDQENSYESLFGKAQNRREEGIAFKLKNDRLLDVFLNGKVWMKTGTMVAYFGIIKFTREGILEHGVKKLVKKGTTGEGTMLTKATGQGNLYLADQGKKISVVSLGGHSLVVNGSNLLAFEETVNWDITFLRQFAAIWKGGIFNVRLNGNGMAAITTVGDPVMLRVRPHEAIMTDMNATVAWSGSLAPQFKTDIAMKTLVGRASGESIQMRFEGDGFVIIQPYEEQIPKAD